MLAYYYSSCCESIIGLAILVAYYIRGTIGGVCSINEKTKNVRNK